MTPADVSSSRTYALDRAHVFHSWSAQAALDPMVVASAEGSWVVDEAGRRYLDFSSQLVFTNLGHQHPRVVAAVQEQAGRLCTVAPQHAVAPRSEAARLVAGLAPDGLDKVFFTNGGAEAVEHAVRMARLVTGRPKVVSTYRSYHGGTATTLGLSGDPRRWPVDTGTAGAVRAFGPYLYRSSFSAADEEQECARALEHLDEVIALEGPATVAAVVLETVPGTAGILPPPPGYLAGVREVCDRYGVLWVADEVMCGFGRTGAWFALDHWGAVPDLVTFAKGVTSGYVPLGGVVLSDRVARAFDDRAYPGGLTYSGHPLACAAAVATIETMRDEGVVDAARRLGDDVLGPGLRALAERHRSVGEVRGLGAFWAVELVRDRATKEPLAPHGASSPAMLAVQQGCLDGGLLPLVVGNRLHVVPPCTTTPEEARHGLVVLDGALSVADGYAADPAEEARRTAAHADAVPLARARP